MGFKVRFSIISILILTISISFSSAQTQENTEKNPKNFYVEIMKLNEKISFWSQQCEKFHNLNVEQDRLIKDVSLQLDQTKDELKLVKDELKVTTDALKSINERQLVTKDELKATKDELKAIMVYNSIIKPELQHLRRVNDYYEEKADYTWTITNMSYLLLDDHSLWDLVQSQEFRPWKKSHSTMQFFLRFPRDYVTLRVHFTDFRLIEPYPVVYATVTDRSGNNKDHVRYSYLGKGLTPIFTKISKNYVEYIFVLTLINKATLRSPFYAINDTMTIDVRVEPSDVAKMVYSRDGKMTWAIDQYRKRKEMAVEGLIESHRSPYFYTADGIRMQVSAFLNGNSKYKSKGLTMTVNLLTVSYTSKFQKTRVTLFNPVDAKRNVSRCVLLDVMKTISYSMDMGEVEGELVYGDTLYYEVVIDGVVGDETEVECARDNFEKEGTIQALDDSVYHDYDEPC